MIARAAWILALAASATTCTPDRGKPARERQARIESLRLPEVQLPDAGSPRPAIRIAITGRSIDVDDIEVVASWPRDELARFLATLDPIESASVPLIESDVVKLSSGRIAGADLLQDWPAMRQLSLVLDAAMNLEARYAALQLQEPRAHVVIHAESSVPYETVTRVIEAAVQSRTATVSFAVRAGAVSEIPLRARRGGSLAVGCVVPRVTVLDQGVAIELVQRHEVPGPARRQIIVGPQTCPSAPRKRAALDMELVSRILEQHVPTCAVPEALVGGPSTQPWGEVAQLAAAVVRTGRPLIDTFSAEPAFAQDLLACSRPIECPGPECPSPTRGTLPPGGRPPPGRASSRSGPD